MDINQIKYFLNLAETRNFTEAARRSGVSQPSLTKAIRKLEDELGGPLIYRDGKDSRLTSLGRDMQGAFMRIDMGLMEVRELAENSVRGRKRVIRIGVATTITPTAFADFIAHVLRELPSVVLNVLPLTADEGADEILSGKYDACILTAAPKDNVKLATVPLFSESYLLAVHDGHPFAKLAEISVDQMAGEPYVDRLACEFHSQIVAHFMDRGVLMQPRFSAEREDWVQQMVASGQAVCIMPERSTLVAGITARPVAEMDLSRQITLTAVSGSGTPTELRQILKLAQDFVW